MMIKGLYQVIALIMWRSALLMLFRLKKQRRGNVKLLGKINLLFLHFPSMIFSEVAFCPLLVTLPLPVYWGGGTLNYSLAIPFFVGSPPFISKACFCSIIRKTGEFGKSGTTLRFIELPIFSLPRNVP